MAATIPTGLRLYQPILFPPGHAVIKAQRLPRQLGLEAAAESLRVSMQRRTSRSASVMVLLLSDSNDLREPLRLFAQQMDSLFQRLTAGTQRPFVTLEVAVNVRDRPPHVLPCRGAYPPQQDAVFRIPYFQGHVGGLPLSFEEGTARKVGAHLPGYNPFAPAVFGRASSRGR